MELAGQGCPLRTSQGVAEGGDTVPATVSPLHHHCITRKITLRDNAVLLNRSTVNFDERVLPVRRWRVTTAIPLCWCDNVDGRADAITTLSGAVLFLSGLREQFCFCFLLQILQQTFFALSHELSSSAY